MYNKIFDKKYFFTKNFFLQNEIFQPKDFFSFLTKTNLTKKSFEQVQGTNRCLCKEFKSLQV